MSSEISTSSSSWRRLVTLLRTCNCASDINGIIKSKYPDVEIPENISLSQYVLSKFDHYGDQVAMVEGLTNKSYSYRQLKDLVHRCGSGLVKAGFKQGDVCALYLPNMPEFFMAFYSVISIGGTVSPANPTYTAYELSFQLNNSEAKWIITTSALVDKANEAASKATNINAIYVIGGGHREGCIPFTNLMEDDGSAFPASVNINTKEDVAVLSYSSGTTGLPKAVMLTHYNIVANLHMMRIPGILDLKSGQDVVLCVLPFFHSYGMVVVLANSLYLGAKLVTMQRFEPKLFLQLMEKHRVTQGLLVPPIVLFLIKDPMVDNYDLSSLVNVLCAAAPLGAEHVSALKNKLRNKKLIVRQGFGLTETSPATNICSRFDVFHPGSVGPLLPNSAAKVVDVKTGKILGVGQDGEICFRGPHVMKGYLKNEEATNITIKDRWLFTGDIGHYDREGHFYIIDRLKELIKYKAFQVAPAELEALLLTHPEIQDAAVIGKPDEDAGELPKAFVVPKTDKITPNDVIQFVQVRVSPHKRLRGGVEFVSEIPKSASGKILRRFLKAKEIEKMKLNKSNL